MGCDQVENVFIRRMGLGWRDAVALMGAHTIGRGDASFSGHHGSWVDTDEDALVSRIKCGTYRTGLYHSTYTPHHHIHTSTSSLI